MIEEVFLFNVQKGRSYYVMIYYKGEIQLDASGQTEMCDYYNAYISIDTMKRLSNELQCLND